MSDQISRNKLGREMGGAKPYDAGRKVGSPPDGKPDKEPRIQLRLRRQRNHHMWERGAKSKRV